MLHLDTVTVIGLFAALLAAEYFAGITHRHPQAKNERLIDFVSLLQLGLIKPAVMFLAFALAALVFPDSRHGFAELPFWLGFLIVFLPDDFSHYWIHRLAHRNPRVWGLHRTHHTPAVYQVSIAFRENWLWFWVMPGFWWMGAMVYFGLLEQVVLSATVIGVHNVLLHTGFEGDRTLYRRKRLRRFVRYFEYLINTPSLHRGHHGLGDNGVPAGNFAQTLFVGRVVRYSCISRRQDSGTIRHRQSRCDEAAVVLPALVAVGPEAVQYPNLT